MIERVKEKLKLEMEQNKDNGYVQFIGNALLDRLRDIPSDAEAILTEGKTIVGSFNAMEEAAKAKKDDRSVFQKFFNGRCVMIAPDEGIKIVLQYFGIKDYDDAAHNHGGSVDEFNIRLEDLLQ